MNNVNKKSILCEENKSNLGGGNKSLFGGGNKSLLGGGSALGSGPARTPNLGGGRPSVNRRG